MPYGPTTTRSSCANDSPPPPPPSACFTAPAPRKRQRSITQREVLFHPFRHCTGRRTVSGIALRVAGVEFGYGAVPSPLLEEPSAVTRPEGLPVIEPRSRSLADVVDEHPLVVQDLEVVHPHGECDIEILSARNLVALVPGSELPHQIGVHDVHDRAGRSGERRQHLDLGSGLRANGSSVAGRGECGHDNRGTIVTSGRFEQRLGPILREDGVVVAERDVLAAGGGQPLIHAAREPEVLLIENGVVGCCTGVCCALPLGAVVNDDQLVSDVGVSPDRLDESPGVFEVVPCGDDDRQLRLNRSLRTAWWWSKRRSRAHTVEDLFELTGS